MTSYKCRLCEWKPNPTKKGRGDYEQLFNHMSWAHPDTTVKVKGSSRRLSDRALTGRMLGTKSLISTEQSEGKK